MPTLDTSTVPPGYRALVEATGLVDLTGPERGEDAKEHRHAANTASRLMQMQLDAARTAICDLLLRTAVDCPRTA